MPWELRPNYRGYFKLEEFRTNSKGLRADREFAIQKPDGTTRVAVIGDSFTMPTGVLIEDAYHSVLERELNGRFAHKFEFLNFGVGGYSLANYLTVLTEKALAYQPDRVVIGLCLVNDIPVFKDSQLSDRRSPRRSVLKHKHPFYGYWTLELLDRAQREISRKTRPKPKFDLDEFDRLLDEFKRIRDQKKLEMTFAILRRISSTEGERYRIAIRHLAKHGLEAVDTGSEFGPSIDHRYLTTVLDRHPNALANRKFADALLREVSWVRE